MTLCALSETIDRGFVKLNRALRRFSRRLSCEAKAFLFDLHQGHHIAEFSTHAGYAKVQLGPGELLGSVAEYADLINVTPKIMRRVLAELARFGIIATRTIYRFGTVVKLLDPSQYRDPDAVSNGQTVCPKKADQNQQLALSFTGSRANLEKREESRHEQESNLGGGESVTRAREAAVGGTPPIPAVGRSDFSDQESQEAALRPARAPEADCPSTIIPARVIEAAGAHSGRNGEADDDDDEEDDDEGGGGKLPPAPPPPERPQPTATLTRRQEPAHTSRAGIFPHELPAGWEPDGVTMHHGMARCGLTMAQIEDELLSFRVRRAGKELADWQGEFRNWLKRSFKITDFRGDIPMLNPAAPMASLTMSTWGDDEQTVCEILHERDDDDD